MANSYVPVALAREVRERARNRCEYCQTPADYAPEPFEMEHLEPRAFGGASESANLALACGGCNGYKGPRTMGVDVETSAVVSLFHPRRGSWSDHFIWSDDSQVIIGLTPVGRATIEVLRMNRPNVCNLRWLLGTQGLHPPDRD